MSANAAISISQQQAALQVAEFFGNAVPSGDGFMCNCPAEGHDDQQASCWVAPNHHEQGGALVAFCHAGCQRSVLKSKLADAMASLSLDSLEIKRKRKAKPADVYLTARYDYVFENGQYAFSKARYLNPQNGEKDFRTGFIDKRGRFQAGSIKSVEHKPLYNLSELLKAEPEDYVFIVEGEKDVETLRSHGLIAVCNFDGAGEQGDKWQQRYNAYFKGLNVTLLPDNDAPGRKHAAAVATQLSGISTSVVIVELPNLPDHGDVSDWLTQIGTIEQLLNLVDQQAASDFQLPWRDRLIYTRGDDPQVKNLEFNIALYLQHHEDFAGHLRFNSFKQVIEYDGEALIDGQQDVMILTRLQELGISATREKVLTAMKNVALMSAYDSLMDYVNALQWDGTKRLDQWLAIYCGSDSQSADYLAEVGKRWMISGIARAMQPGCKADQWLILEGEQGRRKSTGLEALCPDPEWFQDQLPDVSKNTKDAKIALFGHWVVEVAELEAIRKADQEAVKKFASLRVDKERLPYDRTASSLPRRCIFAGTHNPKNAEGYLTDPTGNRRFLPVQINAIDITAIRRDRDQLWAEAKHLYLQGERWWTVENDDRVVAEQRKRFKNGDWAEEAFHYLEFEPDIVDRLTDPRHPRIQWRERELPLDVFVPNYFWQDIGEPGSWRSAPFAVKNEINGSFQNAGWEKFSHRRYPELAKAHGEHPRKQLSGWFNPFSSEAPVPEQNAASEPAPSANNAEPEENQEVQPQVQPPDEPQVEPPANDGHSSLSDTHGSTGYKDLEHNNEKSNQQVIVQSSIASKSVTDAVEPTMERLKHFLACHAGQVIGFDLETTSLRPENGRVRLAQFWCDGQGVVVDCDEIDGFVQLKSLLTDSHLVAFNAQFEIAWMRNSGIEIKQLDDAKLAYAAIYGGSVSLAKAAQQLLGITPDKSQQKSDWSGELTEAQLEYALEDARIALLLWGKLADQLYELQLVEGYQLLRSALLPLAMMRESGMCFDQQAHADLIETLQSDFNAVGEVLKQQAPEIANWNSPKQIIDWLEPELTDFKADGLHSARNLWPRTAKGKLSVSATAISEAMDRGLVPTTVMPVLENYLRRQKNSTWLKTFGQSLADRVEADGRIRGNIQIAGAVTGRMSSSEPNLQNFPKDKAFRSLFIASPGNQIVVCDYSQIEVRVGGLLAGEQTWLDWFKNNHDAHSASAALMLHKPYEDVTAEERQRAKGVTFGMQYGMQAKSLSKIIKVSEAQAQTEINLWLEHYPAIAQWRKQQYQQGQQDGFLMTAAGRRICLSRNPPPSVCYNYPVQGSAADVMYAALAALADRVEHDYPHWRLLTVVHDEVVMEVPAAETKQAKQVLEQAMSEGFTSIFPEADTTGLVSADSGSSWAAKS